MSNKQVLITGSAGFIGSHLTELCVEKGYDVKAFVHYNSRNYWGWQFPEEYIHSRDYCIQTMIIVIWEGDIV